MDIKAYWKAYHAKNKDRINEGRRYRYKMSKPASLEGIKLGIDDHPIRYDAVEVVARAARQVEEEILKMENDKCKCCACHLPGKHYKRNRWFCDAHRP